MFASTQACLLLCISLSTEILTKLLYHCFTIYGVMMFKKMRCFLSDKCLVLKQFNREREERGQWWKSNKGRPKCASSYEEIKGRGQKGERRKERSGKCPY